MNEASAKIVLMEACNKLKEVGEAYVIGPIAGSTWNSYRLVTHSDGSMPFLMEPKYKPGYSQWLENIESKPTYQYFSTKETIERVVEKTTKANQNEINQSKLKQSELESNELGQSVNEKQGLLEIKTIKLTQLEEAFKALYRGCQQL